MTYKNSRAIPVSHTKDTPNVNNTSTGIKNIHKHMCGFLVQKNFRGKKRCAWTLDLEEALLIKNRFLREILEEIQQENKAFANRFANPKPWWV